MVLKKKVTKTEDVKKEKKVSCKCEDMKLIADRRKMANSDGKCTYKCLKCGKEEIV